MTERPAYRLPRNVLPEHYSLVLEPDFAEARFDGQAVIDIQVVEPTAEVVLNAADLQILTAALVQGGRRTDATVEYRSDEEQVAILVPEALAPGGWQLELQFAGKLNDLLRGFYRSKFTRQDGQEEWVAVTQFESTDARRAFPCWDEPDLKATFGITLVADQHLTALSNAGEISSEVTEGGKRRTTFANTVKMSTYLVAIVIGPFELTSPEDIGGVPLRIAYVPGRENLTGLAAQAAAHSLRFLADYFAIPYPADKLDHIAIPDFAAGAMENLGLVTYRETALLVSAESAQVEQQRVVSTIAHETAHMWFGDLVTMRWWEGIWLNEAFATFMELLVTDAFRPEWQIWANFGVDRAAALATDSLRASRSIEYPVGRPEEAEDMFDVITYDKGGSVLRMIERYLGGETFRRGLHLYLDKHKFSNTVTTDLWDALEVASGVPVRTTMGTWVNQAGHPVVSARMLGATELELSQQRFLLDGGTEPGQLWVVPLTLRYGTAGGGVEHEQLLLPEASKTITLKGQPEWLVVNEHAWGVYRSNYDQELLSRLFGALDQLDDREKLSLVNDNWAATVAGLIPLESSLDLWSRLRDDEGPDVWWAISAGMGLLDIVSADADRPKLNEKARDLAGGLFSVVGWDQVAGEPSRRARLRARLVTLLGSLGADREVQQEARRRLADADAGDTPLPPDLATAVAQVVAAAGGAKEWEVLYSHYKEAKTPQDEVRYLHALGAFSDPELLRRSLDLTFSDEVRNQDAPYLLMGMLGRREGTALAWEAIEEHWDQMQERWPPGTIFRMLDALPALATAGDEMAQRAEAWLDAHPVARGERKIVQARERLRVNLAFKHRVAGQLGAALAHQPGPGAN